MYYLLSCLFSLQLSFINLPSTTATESQYIKPPPISIYEEDLTNDGLKERISLNGELLSEESDYFQSISIDIKTLDAKQWVLQFSGGYKPSIHFLNITHQGTNDLFYESTNGNGDGPSDQHLYTFTNQQLTKISLPKQPYIQAKFLDDFQIHIQLSPLNKQEPIIFNVESRAEEYKKHGIYEDSGKLTKNIRVKMKPISRFAPVHISKKQGYGLKSYQHAYGIDDTDHLGTIETLWYYENGRWTILHTDWVPA